MNAVKSFSTEEAKFNKIVKFPVNKMSTIQLFGHRREIRINLKFLV